ncbi:hypothetical protein BTHI11S_02795 [Bosea thiooxidans]
MMRVGLALLWVLAVRAAAQAELHPVGARLSGAAGRSTFFPGDLLLRVLRVRVGGADMIPFAIALSWAILIASGFVLHAFQALSEEGWFAATGTTMVVLAVAAAAMPGPAPQPPTPLPRIDGLAIAGLAVAAGLAVGAVALAVWQAGNDRPFEILEFWMVEGSQPRELLIGMRNGDLDERHVRLEVRGVGRLIHSEPAMVLEPGQTVQRIVRVPFRDTGLAERISAVLLGEGDRILRHTHMTIGEAREPGRIGMEAGR